MRHVTLAAVLILAMLATTRGVAAEVSVPHSVVLKASYEKVLSVLQGRRAELVAATGAKLVKVNKSEMLIECQKRSFWIKESVKVTPSKTVVTWTLSKPAEGVRFYQNVTECYPSGNTTIVRGTIKVAVGGERKIGTKKLTTAVENGVNGFNAKLKALSGG